MARSLRLKIPSGLCVLTVCTSIVRLHHRFPRLVLNRAALKVILFRAKDMVLPLVHLNKEALALPDKVDLVLLVAVAFNVAVLLEAVPVVDLGLAVQAEADLPEAVGLVLRAAAVLGAVHPKSYWFPKKYCSRLKNATS